MFPDDAPLSAAPSIDPDSAASELGFSASLASVESDIHDEDEIVELAGIGAGTTVGVVPEMPVAAAAAVAVPPAAALSGVAIQSAVAPPSLA
jgi:hypothetical protein